MQLKMPWIDRRMCVRDLDCRAARQCKQDAIEVQEESRDEPGIARDFPLIDMERCKRCGDCEKACPDRAIKMI